MSKNRLAYLKQQAELTKQLKINPAKPKIHEFPGPKETSFNISPEEVSQSLSQKMQFSKYEQADFSLNEGQTHTINTDEFMDFSNSSGLGKDALRFNYEPPVQALKKKIQGWEHEQNHTQSRDPEFNWNKERDVFEKQNEFEENYPVENNNFENKEEKTPAAVFLTAEKFKKGSNIEERSDFEHVEYLDEFGTFEKGGFSEQKLSSELGQKKIEEEKNVSVESINGSEKKDFEAIENTGQSKKVHFDELDDQIVYFQEQEQLVEKSEPDFRVNDINESNDQNNNCQDLLDQQPDKPPAKKRNFSFQINPFCENSSQQKNFGSENNAEENNENLEVKNPSPPFLIKWTDKSSPLHLTSTFDPEKSTPAVIPPKFQSDKSENNIQTESEIIDFLNEIGALDKILDEQSINQLKIFELEKQVFEIQEQQNLEKLIWENQSENKDKLIQNLEELICNKDIEINCLKKELKSLQTNEIRTDEKDIKHEEEKKILKENLEKLEFELQKSKNETKLIESFFSVKKNMEKDENNETEFQNKLEKSLDEFLKKLEDTSSNKNETVKTSKIKSESLNLENEFLKNLATQNEFWIEKCKEIHFTPQKNPPQNYKSEFSIDNIFIELKKLELKKPIFSCEFEFAFPQIYPSPQVPIKSTILESAHIEINDFNINNNKYQDPPNMQLLKKTPISGLSLQTQIGSFNPPTPDLKSPKNPFLSAKKTIQPKVQRMEMSFQYEKGLERELHFDSKSECDVSEIFGEDDRMFSLDFHGENKDKMVRKDGPRVNIFKKKPIQVKTILNGVPDDLF